MSSLLLPWENLFSLFIPYSFDIGISDIYSLFKSLIICVSACCLQKSSHYQIVPYLMWWLSSLLSSGQLSVCLSVSRSGLVLTRHFVLSDSWCQPLDNKTKYFKFFQWCTTVKNASREHSNAWYAMLNSLKFWWLQEWANGQRLIFICCAPVGVLKPVCTAVFDAWKLMLHTWINSEANVYFVNTNITLNIDSLIINHSSN